MTSRSAWVLECCIDPENEECKIAYPNLLFDRDIIDVRRPRRGVLRADHDRR